MTNAKGKVAKNPVDAWWNSIKPGDKLILNVHQQDGNVIKMNRTVLSISRTEMATYGEGNGMKIPENAPVWSKKIKEISSVENDVLTVDTNNHYARKITYTKA